MTQRSRVFCRITRSWRKFVWDISVLNGFHRNSRAKNLIALQLNSIHTLFVTRQRLKNSLFTHEIKIFGVLEWYPNVPVTSINYWLWKSWSHSKSIAMGSKLHRFWSPSQFPLERLHLYALPTLDRNFVEAITKFTRLKKLTLSFNRSVNERFIGYHLISILQCLSELRVLKIDRCTLYTLWFIRNRPKPTKIRKS